MTCFYINSLIVRGPAAVVEDFIRRNYGSYVDAADGTVKTMPLSFNALVPYPAELGVPWGGYAEALYRVLHGTDEELRADHNVQRAGIENREALLEHFIALAPDARELAERYRQNKQKYGHEAWPGWYEEHWGVQHDLAGVWLNNFFINRVSPTEVAYLFDTNWGTPDGWLSHVAPMFPVLAMTLAWEAPEQETTGCIDYRHGKPQRFLERRMWLRECDKDDNDDDPSPHGSCVTEPEDRWPSESPPLHPTIA